MLANLQERAGLSGVTVAAAYHSARDIFPHNPRRRVAFLEPGLFFEPEERLYGAIAPRPSAIATGDPLARVAEAAAARGMQLSAWVVFLHVDVSAGRVDASPRNAFGDRFPTDLCPASPDARRYAVALAADVARYRPARLVAESLHYPLLEHGYHHERYFLYLGPLARFLLALCFCPHCLAAAGAAGVDGEAVRAAVESHLERVFARGDDDRSLDASPAEAGALADGELAAYLRVRESVVASLVDEVAAAVQGAGTSLAFCDLSGAAKGYAAGTPNGEPAAAVAWRFGLDLRAIAAACDEISVCGYAADPKRVRTDLEAYVERLGPAPRLALTLRPMSPDCGSSENLRAKLRIARELGVTRAEFYHYGLAPLTALDTIRAAL